MKLTNKEAADVIMRIQIQLGRRNGKMLLSSALLKAVEVLREAPEWIPIKMRPGTDEEYEKFSLYGDCPREDFRVLNVRYLMTIRKFWSQLDGEMFVLITGIET